MNKEFEKDVLNDISHLPHFFDTKKHGITTPDSKNVLLLKYII